MFFRYLCMEQKKALAVFIKSFRYFICMVLLLGIAVFACSAVFRDAKVLNTVEVAVVIPKEKGEELRLLTGLASAMQSTKSICRMRYVDEPEAMEQLANGQVQAVLIFPEHFYKDLDEGNDSFVRLCVPQESDVSLQTFQELLQDGVSILWTAEAGVSAVLEQAQYGNTKIAYQDIGLKVATNYLKTALTRTGLYDSIVCSPFGEYEQKQYYFSTGLILVLLFTGLCFARLYTGETRVVEQKLSLYGMGAGKIAFGKIVAMTNVLFFLAFLAYGIGCIVTYYLGISFLFWDMRVLLGLYLFCLLFAVGYHLIYCIAGKSTEGMLVLLALELFIVLASGMLIPVDYLPKFVQQISHWTPLYHLNRYNLELLFGNNWF